MLRYGQGHMDIPVENILHALSGYTPVIYLESQSDEHPASRYSYLAGLPEASLTAHGDKITRMEKGEVYTEDQNPWEALRAFQHEQDDWLFGYISYDLKNYSEDLFSGNQDPVRAPDLYFMKPGMVLQHDLQRGDSRVIKGDLPVEISLDFDVDSQVDFDRLEYSVDKSDYLAMIREAQRRITEGEFYEINLSHQLRMDFAGDPVVLYNRMKKTGPVPFGAYLQLDDLTVACASPERFMAKEGDTIYSQPIKGTRGRGQTSEEDERLKEELTSSEKEKAENLMIVDLVRNDFNRVAETGSVHVPRLFDLQTFGTVHQMVSTVQARVGDISPVDILKACFPMGSMTGAPKISAMKSIEELENYRRGIYSGTIGYFTPAGDFDFNVVIRTALLKNNRLYYSVGGAITSESDPDQEWEETLVKARTLTEAMKTPSGKLH